MEQEIIILYIYKNVFECNRLIVILLWIKAIHPKRRAESVMRHGSAILYQRNSNNVVLIDAHLLHHNVCYCCFRSGLSTLARGGELAFLPASRTSTHKTPCRDNCSTPKIRATASKSSQACLVPIRSPFVHDKVPARVEVSFPQFHAPLQFISDRDI